MFDLSILPKKAQDELINFYQFLVERYSQKQGAKINKGKTRAEEIDFFFNKYDINLKEFTFNRNEIYER